MQQLDLNKLTPWNLGANTQLFLSELQVNPKTLTSLTFREIAGFHKSPTVGVSEENIVREAKAQNKFLQVSSYSTSIQPLRPDLSDIEIALLHATKGNIPDDVLCSMLNITRARLKHIRKATEPLYHQAHTPLPNMPLVTITDTSRYWSEDELLETYKLTPDNLPHDYGVHYKDLLRGLKTQARLLDFPINESPIGGKDTQEGVPNRTSIPSTLLKEDGESYEELSEAIWSHVSREEGLSDLLSLKDWDTNDTIAINYTSKVTNKEGKETILKHHHEEGGYNPPLSLPKAILQHAINVYNLYLNNAMCPPSLERLVINLLSAPEYISKELGYNFPTLSSNRGHCLPAKSKYTRDTSPLIYPKFTHEHYGFGVICHHCDTFLSENTTLSCKHVTLRTYLLQETGKYANLVYNMPSIYLYVDHSTTGTDENTLNYSLYYYKKDILGHIGEVFTLNLLQFYTNYSIPLHQLPFE